MQTQAQVLTTMDYNLFALNSLMHSMYTKVPYIAFQWGNERSNMSDLKAYGRPGDK